MTSINGGEIGDVKQVLATFGLCISKAILILKLYKYLYLGFPIVAERLHKKELGGGTILDLGVYTVQLAQLLCGGEMPGVVAAGHLGPGGCDESASITLTYSNGRTATLVTHSRAQLPNEVVCH